jgi:hypothetical protein
MQTVKALVLALDEESARRAVQVCAGDTAVEAQNYSLKRVEEDDEVRGKFSEVILDDGTKTTLAAVLTARASRGVAP